MLLLLACTGTTGDTGDTGDAPLAPWTDHYRAESVITAGGFEFDEEYLVRRFIDPPASVIDEEFIATADGTVTTVHFEVDADAGTFLLTFGDDSYEGTGTLEGDAWAWTAWTSHSVAPDGSWVDSTDTLDDLGIHANKVGYSAEGEEEEWTLVEELSPITEGEWTEARAALE